MGILRGMTGRRVAAVVLAGAMATTVTAVAAPEASAADFYTPPATITGKPGTILKSQSIPLVLQIPGEERHRQGNLWVTSRREDPRARRLQLESKNEAGPRCSCVSDWHAGDKGRARDGRNDSAYRGTASMQCFRLCESRSSTKWFC